MAIITHHKAATSMMAGIICFTAVATGIEIEDNWRETGVATLSGERWQARFQRDTNRFLYSVGDMDVTVSLVHEPLPAMDRCEIQPDDQGVGVDWGYGDTAVRLHFTDYGTVRMHVSTHAALRFESPIAVGLLPGIVMEDVFYRAEDYPEGAALPAENWFAGLLGAGDGMLMCAWDSDETDSRLTAGDTGVFSAFEIFPGQGALHMELHAMPGIWHRQELEPGWLERDVPLAWERPIQAGYRTQAPINGETTTPRAMEFSRGPRSEWRPEVGDFDWPVYFDGDRAVVHYSKKIPPQGDMIAYPAHGAPETLHGFLARTPLNNAIHERNRRRGIPAGPRGIRNVGYNACWGTQLLRRTLYIQGRQYREREFLKEHADFLGEYVAMVQKRNRLYLNFLDDIRNRLAGWADETQEPDILAFVEQVRDRSHTVEAELMHKLNRYGNQLPEEHTAYAETILARLKTLLESPGQELYPEYEHIINEINILSWGNDEDTGMRYNMLAGAWAMDLAEACAEKPLLVPYVRELRAALREMACGAAPW